MLPEPWAIPKIINNGNLARTIERIEAEKETMDFETLRVLKTIIMPPQSDYFTNIIKKLKDGLHVGENQGQGLLERPARKTS